MKSMFALPILLAACGLDVAPEVGVIGGGSGGGGPPQATVFFSLDVLPIFQDDCIHCHGGAASLSLESYEGVLQGGVSGPAVLPFDPDHSRLVARLDGTLPPTMPLDGPPLPEPEIDRIRQWILEGAQDN